MCGIAIIQGLTENKEQHIRKILKPINHRGKKNYEYKCFNNFVFGANRLPIQGKETGTQPIPNEDKTIRAVFNGEIFNYKALKHELEKQGHTFSTQCDTELLVHLYEQHGADEMVKMIDSEMFFFGIIDIKNNDLIVAKDPFGTKPGYIGYDSEDTIYIVSEMKQLTQLDTITKIYHFPAGYIYKNGQLKQWYQLTLSTTIVHHQQTIECIASTLEEAVKKRVETNLDEPLYVFLSGGVDSSTICKLANKYHPNIVNIILGMNDQSKDYQTATKFCRQYGYNFKVIRPDFSHEHRDEIHTIFSFLVWHTESYNPNINMQGLGNYFCSKAVADLGGNIVLVGEGADEIFAGYNTFERVHQKNITTKCIQLVEDMQYRQMRRIESIGMAFTLEVRQPFFDTRLVELALSIPGSMKISTDSNNKTTTKLIMRNVSEHFGLPEYIYSRKKLAFANGANLKVGDDFRKDDSPMVLGMEKYIDDNPILTKQEKDEFQLQSITQQYFYTLYKQHNFNKLTMNGGADCQGIIHKPINRFGIIKDTLSDW